MAESSGHGFRQGTLRIATTGRRQTPSTIGDFPPFGRQPLCAIFRPLERTRTPSSWGSALHTFTQGGADRAEKESARRFASRIAIGAALCPSRMTPPEEGRKYGN